MANTEEQQYNPESILDSIKKLLNIPFNVTEFDADVIIHINSVFANLTQMGIGPSAGFSISDNSTEWSDYISEKILKLQNVKTYIYLKVKMMFDPPTSSIVKQALDEQIKEIEWRLHSEVNYHKNVTK